ncbi:MAG: DUF952 domain-containing protein [Planctomycetota bacterium]|nr:DUF952 domain-containing protein [Planctomycetota bacterium]
MTETTIYKILPTPLWQAALKEGVFRGAGIDLADGYIHFSTAKQVRETAAKHFAGQTDLQLLAVSVEILEHDLPGKLIFEPSRGGDLFPHLYCDMPLAAVEWVKPLPWLESGTHDFPTP